MFGKSKVPSPLVKGVARVPVVMQMEALECGAASLAMVMAYYGKWVPLEQVRLDCGVSRDGSNMKNVYLAAKNYGLDVHGYQMEKDRIDAWIDSVEDLQINLMLCLRFREKKSWNEVADEVGGINTEDSCRKMIDRYLEKGERANEQTEKCDK